MPEIKDRKITHREFGGMTAPMEIDLTFAFKVWQQQAFELIGKAKKENWTEDKLIKEFEKL